jgi:hypothetical protein
MRAEIGTNAKNCPYCGLIQPGIETPFAVRPCYPQPEKISSQAETQGQKRHAIHAADQCEEKTGMPEVNPTAVIADCIEKSKATDDQELIADYIAEALGVLQIDNTQEDAFHMLGSAIADAVADDEGHTAGLLEVWSELEEQRKLA